MEIKSIRNKKGDIETRCPHGEVSSSWFKDHIINLVGGWLCEQCKSYGGVKDVSKDGSECIVICNRTKEKE